MTRISISDIQRKLHKLSDFEIVEVVDKKRNRLKGYFIEAKYAPYVEEMIEKLKRDKAQHRSAAGILHAYARPDKIEGEANAYKESILRRYAKEQKA